MALEPGSHLGPYRIIGWLDAGGMGEIYRAHDPRLSRDVAVKVLKTSGAISPSRLRQFEVEARAAGGLSHPNILVVHDTGSHEGVPYVVSELLEGRTLRDELTAGALTRKQAFRYAIQMAEGLAAAHAKNVVHRDLKPSNLFVTPDGRVKILDFGLAKLYEGDETAEPSSSDATASRDLGLGQFVGTAGYASPEQIRGEPLDHRSDIFSLGAVLYEMASGERAFPGPPPRAAAAVLSEEPPLAPVRLASPAFARIIERCLEKRPSERFQSAHDLSLAVRAVAEQDRPARWRPGLPVALGAVAACVAAAAFFAWQKRARDATPSPMTGVPVTSASGLEYQPALSPDGNYVAFIADGKGADAADLYLKLIGSENTHPLTATVQPECCPAWSPDGRSIAFIRVTDADGTILVVPAAGGSERSLGRIGTWYASSLSWSSDGQSLAVSDRDAAQAPFAVWSVSLATLERRALSEPPVGTLGDGLPVFSPDGSRLAFVRYAGAGSEIYVAPAAGGGARRVGEDRTHVGGLDWTRDGRELVFSSSRSGSPRLWRLDLSGHAIRALAVEDQLLSNELGAEAIWEVSKPFRVSIARSSPRLAYTRGSYDTDIWQMDLGRPRGGGKPAPLLASTRVEDAPQFAPDGRRIAFSSTRGTPEPEIWVCARDGTDCHQLTSLGVSCGTPRWSPDGRTIAFDALPDQNSDIHTVDVDTHVVRRLTREPSEEAVPSWSRDGRSIYFASNRTGRWEVWKMPAGGGDAVRITSEGGFAAFEAVNGRDLYYTQNWAPGLWRLGPGGAAARVLSVPQCWGYWTLGAGGLYALDTSARPRPAIDFHPLPAGAPSRVAEMTGRPACGETGLAVSPDGATLLYVQAARETDIMLLDGFR